MIYFLQNNSFPFGMAASRRRLCYSKGLIASGEKVTVLVCQKVFDAGEGDSMPESGTYNGVSYEYLVGKYKKRNKIMRALDWYVLDYIFSFFILLRRINRDDVMYVYLYPIFLQIVLILVAKIKGAKLVKETCEHPDALRNMTSVSAKMGSWIERRLLMPFYDGFICISKNLEEFVDEYRSPESKTIVVPILVDSEPDDSRFLNEKSPYELPYIVHTGTMLEQKDSVSKILSGFARLVKQEKVECKLVFTGPHATSRCSYLPMIHQLGIEKYVDLLGYVAEDQIARLQHFASMSVIYKSDNLQTRYCFATKLGEMLQSGIPVITTDVGEAKYYLENKKSALIFHPDDETSFVTCMRYILDNPREAKNIAINGRTIALTAFNPIYQGKRLSDFFKSL